MVAVEEPLKSPCLEPGCGSFALYRGRCADHSKQREQQIGRAGKKVYATKAWRLLRRRVIFEEPMCRHCVAEGQQGLAAEVDHINGDPTDNRRANLQPLCKPHHSAKTRAEQIGRTA